MKHTYQPEEWILELKEFIEYAYTVPNIDSKRLLLGMVEFKKYLSGHIKSLKKKLEKDPNFKYEFTEDFIMW